MTVTRLSLASGVLALLAATAAHAEDAPAARPSLLLLVCWIWSLFSVCWLLI